MANLVTNIGRASIAEKYRDAPANGIVGLMIAIEGDDAVVDHEDLAALFGAAGNTEATDPSAGRKTGITGTVTVDHTNNRTDVDLPDQTWSALSGAAIVKLFHAYEDGAAENQRIPLNLLDFAITPDGSDVTANFNAAGIHRSS